MHTYSFIRILWPMKRNHCSLELPSIHQCFWKIMLRMKKILQIYHTEAMVGQKKLNSSVICLFYIQLKIAPAFLWLWPNANLLSFGSYPLYKVSFMDFSLHSILLPQTISVSISFHFSVSSNVGSPLDLCCFSFHVFCLLPLKLC